MERMKPKPSRSDIDTFHRSDSAISAVISAVLVLGLIVTATTMYQVRYVPAWKSDAECSHLADVYEDMANLKSQIDMLSAVIAANPGSQVSVSVPIKMGGGDIPVIGPGRSSGTLSVNDNGCGMWIDANNATGMLPYSSDVSLTGLGSISYRSCNNYYLNQMFEYENGALILVQEDRSLMKLAHQIAGYCYFQAIIPSRMLRSRYSQNIRMRGRSTSTGPRMVPDSIAATTRWLWVGRLSNSFWQVGLAWMIYIYASGNPQSMHGSMSYSTCSASICG
jgi:hypothetical protein